MAAAVANGCVADGRKVFLNKLQEGNRVAGEKNGRINQHNGFRKDLQHVNGVAHKANDEDDWSNGIPLMDWSQYDTYPGSHSECSIVTAALTHIGLYLLMLLGYINQILFTPKVAREKNREGYAPLYNPFEQFFSRYLYRRVRHVFNRPICSTPGATIALKERVTDDYNWSFRFTGEQRECINLGSYNYLGFASGEGECADAAAAATRRWGVATGSSRAELGTLPLHVELERAVAAYLGAEDAAVFGMGFATNSLALPGLLGPGALVLSDANNHASLILGLRLARAAVRVFRHNDVRHLERLAREAIAEARWKKIIIVVEGVYSMEGSIVPLKAIVALKKKLKLYLYLDEAHSIGAMGECGRGVCELQGVAVQDVDVLMGTFTKSFGAAGGYIAGSSRLVRSVRAAGHAQGYAHSMAPCVAAQVLASTLALARHSPRLEALRRNSRLFRRRLELAGAPLLGHAGSPVVPLLVYTFSKMAATVELLTQRGVATVGVGFPATPLNQARIRFCISAAHTPEQLEYCLKAIEEVMDILGLRCRPPAKEIADAEDR